jgi:hypothetical protein
MYFFLTVLFILDSGCYVKDIFCNNVFPSTRSQWRRYLRHGSEAVLFLGLWVRIPPGGGCLSLVSVVCCQVEVSASG